MGSMQIGCVQKGNAPAHHVRAARSRPPGHRHGGQTNAALPCGMGRRGANPRLCESSRGLRLETEKRLQKNLGQ